jgi:hypothetical protein
VSGLAYLADGWAGGRRCLQPGGSGLPGRLRHRRVCLRPGRGRHRGLRGQRTGRTGHRERGQLRRPGEDRRPGHAGHGPDALPLRHDGLPGRRGRGAASPEREHPVGPDPDRPVLPSRQRRAGRRYRGLPGRRRGRPADRQPVEPRRPDLDGFLRHAGQRQGRLRRRHDGLRGRRRLGPAGHQRVESQLTRPDGLLRHARQCPGRLRLGNAGVRRRWRLRPADRQPDQHEPQGVLRHSRQRPRRVSVRHDGLRRRRRHRPGDLRRVQRGLSHPEGVLRHARLGRGGPGRRHAGLRGRRRGRAGDHRRIQPAGPRLAWPLRHPRLGRGGAGRRQLGLRGRRSGRRADPRRVEPGRSAAGGLLRHAGRRQRPERRRFGGLRRRRGRGASDRQDPERLRAGGPERHPGQPDDFPRAACRSTAGRRFLLSAGRPEHRRHRRTHDGPGRRRGGRHDGSRRVCLWALLAQSGNGCVPGGQGVAGLGDLRRLGQRNRGHRRRCRQLHDRRARRPDVDGGGYPSRYSCPVGGYPRPGPDAGRVGSLQRHRAGGNPPDGAPRPGGPLHRPAHGSRHDGHVHGSLRPERRRGG